MYPAIMIVLLLWGLLGCSAYDAYQKGITRAISPEYRAYETAKKKKLLMNNQEDTKKK